MSPRNSITTTATALPPAKLFFNADLVAIGIALAAAVLIRLNVIHHISW